MSGKDDKPIKAGAPAEGGSTTDWSNIPDGGMGTGVPDGLHKTADWTGEMGDLGTQEGALGTGVPDGLHKTADWTGEMGTLEEQEAGIGRGVPDGLNKTADWSDYEGKAPVGPGAPNLNTTDWTDRPLDSGTGEKLNATAVIPAMARQERAARLERRTNEMKARQEESAPAKSNTMHLSTTQLFGLPI